MEVIGSEITFKKEGTVGFFLRFENIVEKLEEL